MAERSVLRTLLALCALTRSASAPPIAAEEALDAWLRARPRANPFAAPSHLRNTPDPDCPNLPAPVPLPAGAPPAALAAALASVSALLGDFTDEKAAPGASLVVTYRGATLLNASAGLADKAAGVAPSTSGTLWRVGSVSKLCPAVLLAAFADADGGGARSGALRLDDAVADHAPAFAPRNPFDSARPTFRQLASHTSGLQRECPFGANSTADALAGLSAPQAPLILPPGTRPSYSNAGFAVLGHVLAELVAQPPTDLAALVADEITRPLGMQSTGFDYAAPGVAQRLAVGYDAAGDPVPFYDMGWAYPAGSMYANVEDLARLAVGLLAAANATAAAGRLALSPGAARELLGPQFYNRDGLTMVGSPWEIRVVPAGAAAAGANVLALQKGGNLPGYSTVLVLVPALELSLSAAFNGGVDEFAFAQDALAALVPPLVSTLAALQPQPAFDPSPRPGDYVGTYMLAGTQTLVRFQQGMLLWYCGALGFQVILDHLEGDLFRAAFPDSSFACLSAELTALRYQVVAFGRNATDGSVSTTQMAGWIPGAVWTKVPTPTPAPAGAAGAGAGAAAIDTTAAAAGGATAAAAAGAAAAAAAYRRGKGPLSSVPGLVARHEASAGEAQPLHGALRTSGRSYGQGRE